MHRNGNIYEYVAVYVDDLAFAVRDPQAFVNILKSSYQFKIKEAGPLEFHLGTDFFCDEDGTLCMAPQKLLRDWWHHMKRCLVRSLAQRCTHHWKKVTIQS